MPFLKENKTLCHQLSDFAVSAVTLRMKVCSISAQICKQKLVNSRLSLFEKRKKGRNPVFYHAGQSANRQQCIQSQKRIVLFTYYTAVGPTQNPRWAHLQKRKRCFGFSSKRMQKYTWQSACNCDIMSWQAKENISFGESEQARESVRTKKNEYFGVWLSW